MIKFKKRDIFESLHDLLDQERIAVLEGNIDTIQRINHEKIRRFDDLKDQVTDTEKLKVLKRKTQHNQKLLESASKGIRAAADAIAGKQTGVGSLQVYDQSGRRQSHRNNISSMERRA